MPRQSPVTGTQFGRGDYHVTDTRNYEINDQKIRALDMIVPFIVWIKENNDLECYNRVCRALILGTFIF